MRLIKSKHKYKIFFPEMTSSILQYLNIISLVNLFNDLDNNNFNKKTGNIIDYKFRSNQESNLESNQESNETRIMNREMNLGLDYNNEDELQDELQDDLEDENNLIESVEIKQTNSNIKIIGGFIISYLDKINEVQLVYDELTTTKINAFVTLHDQKLRTANLKSFEWLSKTGNEAERQLVLLQMHKLKKLKYADLAKYISKEYGAEFNNLSTPSTSEPQTPFTDGYNDDDDFAIIESDNYEYGEGTDNNNVYEKEYDEDGNEKEKKDIEIDLEEIGQVFDEEENENGDQDYGYLAVGDGDQD